MIQPHRFVAVLILLMTCTLAAFTQTHIRVGVYDNPPKIFINEKGQPDGFYIDLIKTIAVNENLTVDFVPGNWNQLTEQLEKGEIDLLPDMSYTKERDSLYSFNKLSLLPSWLEIFTLKGVNIHNVKDMNGKRIGVLKHSVQETYMEQTVKADFSIDYKLMTYDTYEASVNALKEQEVDVIVCDRFFYFSTLCDQDILSTGIILRPTELMLGFTKGKNPQLIERMDKQISLLKNNPNSLYYNSLHHWLDKEHAHAIPRYIYIIILIVITSLLLSLLFIFLLQKQVKNKTADLVKAKEKAEENDRLKTAFLHTVSHEIRTPMNAIMGFSSLLPEQFNNQEKLEQFSKIIDQRCTDLLMILDDVLDFSRIESGQCSMHRETCNINAIFSELNTFFKDYAVRTNKQHIKLAMHTLDESVAEIETDKLKVKQILINLLTNAYKYTLEGSIECGCSRIDDRMRFYVSDSGIGIPSDQSQHVFDRFVQLNDNRFPLSGGTGLGLPIVKGLVELLGGEVWIESEVNKGTTVYFTLVTV